MPKIVLRLGAFCAKVLLCGNIAGLALLGLSIDGEFFDFSKFLVWILILGAGAGFSFIASKVFEEVSR